MLPSTPKAALNSEDINYNAQVNEEDKLSFEKELIERLIVVTDNHTTFIDKRSLDLYRAKTFLIVSLIVAGGKLKATTHWNSPNTGATNETNFSALPGGTTGSYTFFDIGNLGIWWRAPVSSADFPWSLGISHNNNYFFNYNSHKAHGSSVLCLRD